MPRQLMSVAVLAAAVATATLATACGAHGGSTTARLSTRTARVGQTDLQYRYMTDTSDGERTESYGYNLVDLGPFRSAIDALPTGQRALVWIGDYDNSTCSFTRSDADIRRALAGLAGDRKVAGYYIADEPDDALPAYGGHCPDVVAQVTARSRLMHSLAPGAFTYEVVTEPANFAAFAKTTDVLGADPYPCRAGQPCDWTQIPRYVAALRAAHVARYWGVLQTFSGQGWRYPTAAELLAMIRQWQKSDWQGEQTFAWSFAGHSLARRPRLLGVLRSLNRGSAGTSGSTGARTP